MPLPFNLGYDTPDTLGVDRLAAAAAGWVHYGQADSRSVLVIDAGTAVNYEVIHREGRYEGGAIGAGPVLLQQALRTGTAQLPDVPLTLPTDTAVGRSTQTALQSGIMWGLVDSVRGMCDRLAPSLPDAPRRVLTGGWGALLAEHLDDTHHAPHLILHGVRLLTLNAAEAESRPT
jgi:type III pantothenate kinase